LKKLKGIRPSLDNTWLDGWLDWLATGLALAMARQETKEEAGCSQVEIWLSLLVAKQPSQYLLCHPNFGLLD
jgi:hypothetical protein